MKSGYHPGWQEDFAMNQTFQPCWETQRKIAPAHWAAGGAPSSTIVRLPFGSPKTHSSVRLGAVPAYSMKQPCVGAWSRSALSSGGARSEGRVVARVASTTAAGVSATDGVATVPDDVGTTMIAPTTSAVGVATAISPLPTMIGRCG